MKANSPQTQKLMNAFKLHETQQLQVPKWWRDVGLHPEFDECKKKKKRKKNWETKTHVRIIKSNIVKEDKNKVNEPINMLKVAVPLARTKQVEPATSWTILLPSTAEQQLPPT